MFMTPKSDFLGTFNIRNMYMNSSNHVKILLEMNHFNIREMHNIVICVNFKNTKLCDGNLVLNLTPFMKWDM